jgi:hypothetical protein
MSWRVVQVRAGQLVLALDLTKRGVARQAQQPANALAARGLLIRAAGVVMVYEDGLPSLERAWQGDSGQAFEKTVGRTGFEPVTSSVSGKDDTQVKTRSEALACHFILH